MVEEEKKLLLNESLIGKTVKNVQRSRCMHRTSETFA